MNITTYQTNILSSNCSSGSVQVPLCVLQVMSNDDPVFEKVTRWRAAMSIITFPCNELSQVHDEVTSLYKPCTLAPRRIKYRDLLISGDLISLRLTAASLKKGG